MSSVTSCHGMAKLVKHVNLMVDEETHQRLGELSYRQYRPMNAIIRQAIAEYLAAQK